MRVFIYLFFFLEFAYAQEKLELKGEMVSLDLLRSTYSHLTDEAYEKKLKGSLERPLLFFRSFVNTFYAEFRNQPHSQLKGICFGDAHPENFGFILFEKKTRFVFNDLDDSGECPIEFDLLRYFIALSLGFDDQAINDQLLDHFVDVSQDSSKKVDIDPKLVADLEKKNQKIIKRYVLNDKFQHHEDIFLMDQNVVVKIINELKPKEIFKRIEILDVTQVARESGGSGGLQRYWLLVKDANKSLDILELKQVAKSGLSFLVDQPNLSAYKRLEILKNKMWEASPQFYHVISFNKSSYLLRSRTKDDVNLSKLTKKELREYLKSQVSILAIHHAKISSFDPVKMARWLRVYIPILRKRYETTYLHLLKNNP